MVNTGTPIPLARKSYAEVEAANANKLPGAEWPRVLICRTS